MSISPLPEAAEQERKVWKMEEKMEIMMPQASRKDAEEMVEFVSTLTREEREEMRDFFRGVQYGYRLAKAGSAGGVAAAQA